jgi:hypothetical protein
MVTMPYNHKGLTHSCQGARPIEVCPNDFVLLQNISGRRFTSVVRRGLPGELSGRKSAQLSRSGFVPRPFDRHAKEGFRASDAPPHLRHLGQSPLEIRGPMPVVQGGVCCEAFRSITRIHAMKRSRHTGLSIRSRNVRMTTGADGGVYVFGLGLRPDGSRTRPIQDAHDRNAHARQPRQYQGSPSPLRIELSPHDQSVRQLNNPTPVIAWCPVTGPSSVVKAFATPNGEHQEMLGRWR